MNRNSSNYFAIKMRFDTPKGGEHIWISNIVLENGDYFGVVGNSSESTTDVNLGDSIKIDKSRISDWMYLDHGELRGGYTIRLLRSGITAEERKKFDAEMGMIIED